MCMIWHDVTKEPLPKGHDVLARTVNKYAVLYDHVNHYDVHRDVHVSSEFDYDPVLFNSDGTCFYPELKVTHWSYIDPTGLPDDL